MIVLDTHALLWWALDPYQLSKRATEITKQIERQGAFASSISIWELCIKVKRKKLELPLSISEFSKRLEHGSAVECVPVDNGLWIRSLELKWSHNDLADRIISATAFSPGLPLLTKDQEMRKCPGLKCIW